MRYVIIGNSAAAVGAVESIRKVDQAGQVVIIGDEPYHVYSRPLIAHFLAGEVGDDRLAYRSADFYERMQVQAVLGYKATRIDLTGQQVYLANEKAIDFDRLLICTGSCVTKPNIKGIDLRGVTTFQKLTDAYYIKNQSRSKSRRAVVVGGGFIGLRAAQSLREAGIDVALLVRSRVMRRVLDAAGSALVESLLQAEGIEIIKGRALQEIQGQNGQVAGIILDDGRVEACGIVVVATGVAPNLDLVTNTGVQIDKGILVNQYLQTTYSNVFAAGDVAQTYDIPRGIGFINANWPNAHEQGGVAGFNMAGARVPYHGSIGMNVISIGAVPVVALGITDPASEQQAGYEQKTRTNKQQNIYQKLVFKDNRLKGAIFIGDLGLCGAVKELIREQTLVGIIKDSILSENYQLYGFLRKKRQAQLEGRSIQWPETYVTQNPYRKSFNEASWTERERDERKWSPQGVTQ
ncbi:MAG TPA: NAD(P)/FAD-dependent oxidoreductase [Desulfotomaculum sp.]|nr:NAD(P)/FAD-dependent oxidoreductase [Desulfotomaculum sp.]